jgi:hypothetical protein
VLFLSSFIKKIKWQNSVQEARATIVLIFDLLSKFCFQKGGTDIGSEIVNVVKPIYCYYLTPLRSGSQLLLVDDEEI